MTRWTDIATIIGSVLVDAGVLVGGTRWAVESAVEPLRVEIRELRGSIEAQKVAARGGRGNTDAEARTQGGALASDAVGPT